MAATPTISTSLLAAFRPAREALSLFLILAFCAMVGVLYTGHQAERIVRDDMRNTAANAALAASLLIDAEAHGRLVDLDMWSDEHKAALEPLIDFHRRYPDLFRVRTVLARGGDLVAVLDTESVAGEVGMERPVNAMVLGEPFPPRDASHNLLASAVRSSGTDAAHESVQTPFGTYLSGTAPLAGGGAVEAAIEVSAREREMVRLRDLVRIGGALAFFASAVVGIVFFNLRSAQLASESESGEAIRGREWVENRNRTLVNALGQLVLHRDLVDDVLLWDGESEHLLGTPMDAMPLKTAGWLRRIHEDDQALLSEAIKSVGAAHPVFTAEYRARREDGIWRWFEERGCVTFDLSGKALSSDSVVIDVTARHNEQEEKAALAMIAARTDNAVCLLDAGTGSIVWVNEAFSRITGVEADGVVGSRLGAVVRGTDRTQDLEPLIEKARSGERSSGTCELIRGRDEVFWVNAEIQPLESEPGGAGRIVAILSDITASKEFESRLLTAKEAAETADRAKSDFLAVMSHELRTPLNAVIGFTNLLLESDLESTQRDYVSTIRDSGDSLLLLVNDILDFARMEASEFRIQSNQFSLLGLVEDSLDSLAYPAGLKGLDLISVVPGDLQLEVMGDHGRIRQILVNLAGNAVKFTKAGEVVVSVSRVARSGDETRIRFEVRDTGCGIPADQQNLLFKPFSQLDSTSSREFGGTGLGLAISKRLCTLLNGVIGVESEVGRGSTFWFELPLKVVGPATGVHSGAEGLSGTRVLLAVANETLASAMSDQLGAWGVSFEKCFRGRDVVHEAGHRRFDVLLLDQDLPDMEPGSIFERLRTTSRGSAAGIIMLTSVGAPQTPESVSAIREFAVPLRKPVRLAALANAIVLGSSRSRGAVGSSDLLAQREAELSRVPAMEVSRPRAKPVAPPSPPPPSVQSSLPSLRVLVVDDNAINRKLVSKVLVSMGYDADHVDSGEACLDLPNLADYDLILMDVQMPGLDGCETTGALRKAGVLTPVIALTADAMPDGRQKCLAAGMDEYLPKPIRRDALEAMISKFTTRHPGG